MSNKQIVKKRWPTARSYLNGKWSIWREGTKRSVCVTGYRNRYSTAAKAWEAAAKGVKP